MRGGRIAPYAEFEVLPWRPVSTISRVCRACLACRLSRGLNSQREGQKWSESPSTSFTRQSHGCSNVIQDLLELLLSAQTRTASAKKKIRETAADIRLAYSSVDAAHMDLSNISAAGKVCMHTDWPANVLIFKAQLCFTDHGFLCHLRCCERCYVIQVLLLWSSLLFVFCYWRVGCFRQAKLVCHPHVHLLHNSSHHGAPRKSLYYLYSQSSLMTAMTAIAFTDNQALTTLEFQPLSRHWQGKEPLHHKDMAEVWGDHMIVSSLE